MEELLHELVSILDTKPRKHVGFWIYQRSRVYKIWNQLLVLGSDSGSNDLPINAKNEEEASRGALDSGFAYGYVLISRHQYVDRLHKLGSLRHLGAIEIIYEDEHPSLAYVASQDPRKVLLKAVAER